MRARLLLIAVPVAAVLAQWHGYDIAQAQQRNGGKSRTLLASDGLFDISSSTGKQVDALTAAIKRNPTSPQGYVARGKFFTAAMDDDKAIVDFNSALKLDANCREAYLERAHAYQGKEQYDKALADFDKADSYGNDEFSLAALREAAELRHLLRRYPEAVRDFDRLIKNTPRIKSAMLAGRADCLMAMGKFDLALKDLNSGIDQQGQKTSTAWGALRTRARLFARMGQYDRAIVDYTTIIKGWAVNRSLDGLASIYEERGACYIKTGQKELARGDLQIAKSRAKENLNILPFRETTKEFQKTVKP